MSMSFSIFSGKKSYSVVWTTGTSAKRRPLESPVFRMENCDWSLLLQIERSGREDQEWQLYLNKIRPAQGHHTFVINISIENRKGIIECMNYARVAVTRPTSERILWRSKSQVLATYPDIRLDGDVTFVVTFLSDYRCFTDLQNAEVNRSIQTPRYLDVHPCLDTLSSNFGKMFEDSLLTDVELRCGERVLRAHKIVLMARSEVFAAMLSNDMLEKQKSSVEIVDMSYPVLEEFVRYLYTGTLPELDMEVATELYEAGDKYAVDSLKSRCVHFLKENLSEANACLILDLADAHSDEHLKEFVMSYVVRKGMLVQTEKQLSHEHPNRAFDKMPGDRKYSLPRFSKK